MEPYTEYLPTKLPAATTQRSMNIAPSQSIILTTVSLSASPSGAGELVISNLYVLYTTATFTVSGGVAGRVYVLSAKATDTLGNVYETDVFLPIDDEFVVDPPIVPPSQGFGTPVTWVSGVNPPGTIAIDDNPYNVSPWPVPANYLAVKQPSEVTKRNFDVAPIPSIVLASVTLSVDPSGVGELVLSALIMAFTTATFTVSGGVAGRVYTIMAQATDTSGNVYDTLFYQPISDLFKADPPIVPPLSGFGNSITWP